MSDPETMQQFAHLNEVVALQMKIDDLEAEIARLRALLDEVRDATCVPLSDPGAHSWQAFYRAAHARLARCAIASRRALERRRNER